MSPVLCYLPRPTIPPAVFGRDLPLRGILFDKDGTLLSFEATWTPVLRQLALDAANGDPSRAEALLEAGGLDRSTGKFRTGSVIGAGTTDLIVSLWYGELGAAEQAAHAARMDASFHAHGERHSVPVEGADTALAALAERGFVMGVATNDSAAAAKVALAALGMARHFAHIFGYDSVDNRKPAPDQVHLFCAATGLAPAEVAVVGDNPHDLEMARAAGAMAIGVTSGNSSAEDLAPLADVVLASVADLPAWLDRRR